MNMQNNLPGQEGEPKLAAVQALQRQRPLRRSSAFLVELLVVILFFSIASAVTIRLFAAAHQDSIQSERLYRAVTLTQSTCEAIRAFEDSAQALSSLYGGYKTDENGQMVVRFNEDWQPVGDGGAVAFELRVDSALAGQGEQGALLSAEVAVFAEDEEIYRLTAKKYIPRNGGVS